MSAQVFIVDDEPSIHKVLSRAMSRHTDWAVRGAESYAQALQRVFELPFDLLLVDKNLGDGSGVDLVRQVRKRDPLVGIVMMTAQSSIQNAIEMLHLDIDRYIEKPFDQIGVLLSHFKSIIEKTKRRRRTAESGIVPSHSMPAPRLLQPEAARSVLIVTLSASDRLWIEHQFKDRSVIRHANSSKQALAFLEKQPADLVIVDKSVRDPDVFTFIEHINNTMIGVNVAVTSDSLCLSEVQRFIELDVAALLEEPWGMAQFRARVEPLIEVDHPTLRFLGTGT